MFEQVVNDLKRNFIFVALGLKALMGKRCVTTQNGHQGSPTSHSIYVFPLITGPLYPYPVWGSPYQSADHYWPMYNITNGILEDVEGAAHTVVYNGGKIVEMPQLGHALSLDGKDDWVDTGK